MADIKEKPLKTLRALSQMTEPTRPTEIGKAIGEKPVDAGRYLAELLKGGLAEKTDEEKNLWAITEKGSEHLYNIEKEPPSQPPMMGSVTENKLPPETIDTIPAQSDIFRGIGERLGVGSKKGDIRLDSIVYYVQRTANLDDLTSVWNSLTEMGVASDIRKRWIKLYAQNIPGKEVPESLKEKLDAGLEDEKVRDEGKHEIPPKAKRFSVVGGEIIGDPEGDLTFNEALKERAQNLGAKPEQASTLADMITALKVGPEISTSLLTVLLPLITKETTPQDNTAHIIEAMKVGPEISTSLLTVLLPLLTKEKPPQDNTAITMLQQRVEQLAEDRHKAEMEVLRTEIRTGQKSSEADPQIQALTQQISDMREALHNEQLARIQEQNKSLIDQLVGKIGQLDEQVRATREGRTADSKIGLMSSALDHGFGELKGLRADVKPLVEGFISGGVERPTAKRTQKDKEGFSVGLDKGIEKENRLRQMEDKLFLGKMGVDKA